jgi:cyclopropane fatty-acyl-phospholipid synthase-like methyltransferase
MRQGHQGEYELLNVIFKNDDLNIGYFKSDDIDIVEARSLMLDRILRLVPKIAKKTKFLVAGSGYGTTAMSIVDKHLCRVDSVTTDKSSIAPLTKEIEKKEYQKKLYPHLTDTIDNLPTETDNYNVLMSQEIISRVEDKRKMFIVYHASLMAEGRLVVTDFFSTDGLKKDGHELFGYEDSSLWTELDAEKLTNKSGLQKVYSKDFSPELIGYYTHLIDVVKKNAAKVDKKLGKGSADKHIDIYEKKIKLLKKGTAKWSLFVYQKINV